MYFVCTCVWNLFPAFMLLCAAAVQVGPATDEAGRLRVADYADCGFGSSGTAPAAGGGLGVGELPATAVEVESAVLEHFPEEQREDAPFPTKVSACTAAFYVESNPFCCWSTLPLPPWPFHFCAAPCHPPSPLVVAVECTCPNYDRSVVLCCVVPCSSRFSLSVSSNTAELRHGIILIL